MNAMVLKRTYSVKEVADALGVSESTVYGLTKRGELPCMRIGDRVLLSLSVLETKWPEVFGERDKVA